MGLRSLAGPHQSIVGPTGWVESGTLRVVDDWYRYLLPPPIIQGSISRWMSSEGMTQVLAPILAVDARQAEF